MKKLYIKNKNGRKLALNGENGISLVDTTGFGVSTADSYADLNYGFFRNINSKNHPQQTIDGTIIIQGDNPLSMWKQFVDWIMKQTDLLLAYEENDTEYMRNIEINFLEKGEREFDHLSIAASFICLTPWYKSIPLKIEMQPAPINGMQYPFDYDSDLTYCASIVSPFSAMLEPNGHIPATVTLRYEGAAVNPQIVLTGENTGTEYGRCEINITMGNTDVLSFSSAYLDSYIKKNGTDITGDVSPEHDPFFRIPISEPCVLQLLANGELSGNVTASVNYYFRSV